MTDAHDDTPSRGHERIEFDLNPEYNKYGIQPLDDGTVILRVDEESHFFERVGVVRRKQAEVVLKEYIDSEGLGDAGSFRTVESISAGRDEFEQQLHDSIFKLIHEGKVSEKHAIELADDLAESFSEQYG